MAKLWPWAPLVKAAQPKASTAWPRARPYIQAPSTSTLGPPLDGSSKRTLRLQTPAPGAQFGYSLSLSNDGNLLAVGAVGEPSSAKGIDGDQSDTSLESAGAVYVFVRRGAAWSQQAYVKASNTGTNGGGLSFGCAVSLSSDGSTIAVGSTGEPSAAKGINGDQSNKSASEAGAVYVFTHRGDAWSQQAFIKPWNTTAGGALFGYSVA